MTNLSGRQIEELRTLSAGFQIMADLAHAHLTIYANSKERDKLVIVAQHAPNTCFSQYKPDVLETKLRTAEEPVIARTIKSGEALNGRREWTLGMMLDMYTFAIRDEIGAIIACLCFETSQAELNIKGYDYLLESACELLESVRCHSDSDMYRHLSANDGIIITDKQGKIKFANAAAANISTVLGVGHMLDNHIFDRQFTKHIVRETIIDQKQYEKEIEAGNMVLLQRHIPLVKNNQLERTIIIVTDVTEIKKKEKELSIKSAVIQEIHHRVKNNLQTIASLLRLQSRRTKSPEVKAALKESVNRILSISVVHEFLSQQDEEEIDVTVVAKNILNLITQNMLDPAFALERQFTGESVILPSKNASSLALVVNEIIQNAIEHAFEGRKSGIIGVKIAADEKNCQVEIYDNGNGLPKDYQPNKSKSLGLQIVKTLIEDELDGVFELYNDNGTHAKITIPRGEAENG
jgi:two-component sensor histidine kinase